MGLDFLNIMAKREQETALQEKLMRAFAVFDNDGSGFISVDMQSEFRTQMTQLGPNPYTKEEFENFLSEYIGEVTGATNGHPAEEDGLIDYQEFVKNFMLRK